MKGHTHWGYNKEALLSILTPEKREEFESYEGSKFIENCWNCGHSFKQHMHITYTTKVVEREFLSEEAQANISSKMDFKEKNDALKT